MSSKNTNFCNREIYYTPWEPEIQMRRGGFLSPCENWLWGLNTAPKEIRKP